MNGQNSTDCVLPASEDSMLALAAQDLSCYALAHYPAFQLPRFLELLVSKLEAVERGEIKRLILSLPPRHGKSLLASTYFPAWYLGRHPDRYVIATSYGQELADDFGRRVRNTIATPMHRTIFPESKLSDDSAAAHRLNLTLGGAYYAIGRGAAITGRGAHLLLIDDPLKDSEEANSPTIRHGVQQWFSTVAFTRLMPDAAIVLIATRWHEDDVIGWLLREHAADGWQEIRLPAIAEANDPLGRAEGEPLWPERYPLDVLESIRRQLGSAAFASLYQQRPAAIEGAIFKREWWRFYSALPASFQRIVLSIDSAFKKGAENDFSAFTVWGETPTDGFYLLHAWRGRVEFPELKRKVKEFAEQWKATDVLIEDKASGQSLIQELQNDSNLPVLAVKVDSDKTSRAIAITALVEAGKVSLPQSAGFLEGYLDEMSTFPASAHDDYVDSTTQALNHMRHGGDDAGWWQWMREERAAVVSGQPSYLYSGAGRSEPPRISTISPAACSTEGGEFVLTGEHLEAVEVLVDGQKVEVKTAEPSRLTFIAPPHIPGAVNVLVMNAAGTSSAAEGLTYR